MAAIWNYWRNTGEMPRMLRMLCRGGMVAGPLLIVAFAIPSVEDIDVNGQPMSYAEFWRSGVGFSMLLFLGLVTVGCWGLAARNSESRWALVLAPIAPILAFPKLLHDDIGFITLNGICSAILIYACLFRLRVVREYMQHVGGDDSAA